MSELRSTIEALRSEVLAELPDARIEEDFLELVQLEIEGLRRLAELERRRVHARDGHLSIASWLVARLRVGWGRAKRDARLARGLDRMPATRAAVEAGAFSLDAAEMLS